MELGYLLRLPSPGFPSEVATGHEAIDAYLRRVDAGCIGAASVRKLTLLEIRDHLLESRERGVRDGLDPAAAAERAVERFGPAERHAAAQREARWAVWRYEAVRGGLFFAGGMLLLDVLVWGELSTLGPLGPVGAFLFHAVFFGAPFGGWLALGYAKRVPEATDDGSDRSFVVRAPWSSKIAGVGVAIVMSAVAAVGLAGLLGLEGGPELSTRQNLFFFIGGGLLALSGSSAFRRIEVHPDEIRYGGLLRHATIGRDRIVEVRPEPRLRVIQMTMAVSPYRIVWEDKVGRRRRLLLFISPDMVHADRLRAQLEEADAAAGV